MAYASILCKTCINKSNPDCYCAPNSVCRKYRNDTNECLDTNSNNKTSKILGGQIHEKQ